MKSVPSIQVPDLQAGDVLLYGGTDLISRLIQFRTWDDVCHIEVYFGAGRSWASRNGIGVNVYPLRTTGLRYVLRPKGQLDWENAVQWFATVRGTPYGWGDLGRFYMLDIPTKGLICSQFGSELFRAFNYPLFAGHYPAGDESPRDYKITPLLKQVWSYQDLTTKNQ